MTDKNRLRIFMTGVGGQGTLTATNLLARVALEMGLEVSAGEIHGMAQRGGVVESTVLIGGWKSPVISHGEADILLGFEPMETLRALPYLVSGSAKGVVFSSLDPTPSPGVSAGREKYPDIGMIQEKVRAAAEKCWFMHCRDLGRQAGSIQSGNIAMLGALCATGLTPFTVDALKGGIRKFMAPKIVETNLKAVDLGVACV